ncbi:diguanylate cyclase [Caldicellulosiruptoraceae bacterium PP1]
MNNDAQSEINRLKDIIKALNNIGILIIKQKDIDEILKIILNESLNITSSDGGTIYLVEEENKKKYLKIKHSMNRSVNFNFIGERILVDENSIAGYVALTGSPVIINNLDKKNNNFSFHQYKDFDERLNYKTVNLMTIPMVDLRGNVIGVLQIINKKVDNTITLDKNTVSKFVIDFTDDDKELIINLSSQAAILIERLLLYDKIEKNTANTRHALVSIFNSMRQVIANLSEDLLIEQEEFKRYATLDALTGLLTRSEGLSMLEKQIQLAKINDIHFVVGFLDVNNLKTVNDTYGHQEGDEMLKIVSKILQEVVRSYDIVFRYGGDEFVIILHKATLNEANIVWNRIQNKINDFNSSTSKPYKISVSHGFSEFDPASNLSLDELIKIADEEMYKDKRKQKGLS